MNEYKLTNNTIEEGLTIGPSSWAQVQKIPKLYGSTISNVNLIWHRDLICPPSYLFLMVYNKVTKKIFAKGEVVWNKSLESVVQKIKQDHKQSISN